MKTVKTLSVKLCKSNPNTIYVFGDNLLKKGKGGQAKIRDCPNAFGIPTKREPTTKAAAYFSGTDEEKSAVDLAIAQLQKLAMTKSVVFPEDGLGTGRASMETKSPELFKHMNDMLKLYFGSRRTTTMEQYSMVDDFFGEQAPVAADPAKPTSAHVPSVSDTRTQFRGVFLNTNTNREEYKYRVAIAQQSNRNGPVMWITLGFYNCINVAALHYNTAALGIFLGKAKLNPVKPQDCGQGELEQFKTTHALRVDIARLVVRTHIAGGNQLTYLPVETL